MLIFKLKVKFKPQHVYVHDYEMVSLFFFTQTVNVKGSNKGKNEKKKCFPCTI